MARRGDGRAGARRGRGLRRHRPRPGRRRPAARAVRPAGRYQDLLLPLFGAYQAQNAVCALAAVEAFSGTGPLDEELVTQAFAAVTAPGRLEVVRRSPVVIVDSAHNPAGMAASMAAVTEAFGFETLVAVLAVSADKDVPGVLAELEPAVSSLVVTRNSAARSMDSGELERLAAQVFGPDRVFAAPRLDIASLWPSAFAGIHGTNFCWLI